MLGKECSKGKMDDSDGKYHNDNSANQCKDG